MTTIEDDPGTETESVYRANGIPAEGCKDRTSGDRTGVGRRPVLKALGAGTALSVGSGVVIADDSGDNAAAGDGQAGANAFLEDLMTVLSVTHKYHGIDEAIEDGYEEFDVLPPVGHIYQKSDYFDGAEFIGPTDLTEPPSLLFYAPLTGEGDPGDFDLVLAGVEYHVSGDRTSDPPDLFADEETAYELTVTEEEGWHRSPLPETLDVTGLHVWLYLSNPAGFFHGGNPLLEELVDR